MSVGSTYAATQRGEVFTDDQELIVRCCSECSIPYAIPKGMYDAEHEGRRSKGWYCPNGHSQSPTKKDITKLRSELRSEKDRRARLQARLDQTEASLRGQTAAKTRFKNERDGLARRAKAGVCPCCNRTFKQLARHMESKHPEFDGAA